MFYLAVISDLVTGFARQKLRQALLRSARKSSAAEAAYSTYMVPQFAAFVKY
jgi:hypothetical protein